MSTKTLTTLEENQRLSKVPMMEYSEFYKKFVDHFKKKNITIKEINHNIVEFDTNPKYNNLNPDFAREYHKNKFQYNVKDLYTFAKIPFQTDYIDFADYFEEDPKKLDENTWLTSQQINTLLARTPRLPRRKDHPNGLKILFSTRNTDTTRVNMKDYNLVIRFNHHLEKSAKYDNQVLRFMNDWHISEILQILELDKKAIENKEKEDTGYFEWYHRSEPLQYKNYNEYVSEAARKKDFYIGKFYKNTTLVVTCISWKNSLLKNLVENYTGNVYFFKHHTAFCECHVYPHLYPNRHLHINRFLNRNIEQRIHDRIQGTLPIGFTMLNMFIKYRDQLDLLGYSTTESEFTGFHPAHFLNCVLLNIFQYMNYCRFIE